MQFRTVLALCFVAFARGRARAVVPGPSADVADPSVIVSGAGLDAPSGQAPIDVVHTTNPNGSVEVSAVGGKASSVFFGPGLAQSFTGYAQTQGFARAAV